MQAYDIDTKRLLGKGSFGQVFRAKHRESNQIVAIKRIRFDPLAVGIPGVGLREISNLKALSHKRVAKLINAEFIAQGVICMIMEFADMDLRRFITTIQRNHNGGSMPEPLAQRLSRQFFKGLAHLHENGIVHRDLKPGNILIDKKQSLKIADFGLSRIQAMPFTPVSHETSTLAYRPPEILLGESLHVGSYDMWSAGCIVAEMMRAGVHLFPGSRPHGPELQLESIFKTLGTPDEVIWPHVSLLPKWKKLKFPMYEPKSALELFPGVSTDGMDFILTISQESAPPPMAQ